MIELKLYSKRNTSGYDLKKIEKEKLYNVQVTKNISVSDIENIIVTAFEGGTNYWCGIDNTTPEWNTKPKDMPVSQYIVELLVSGETVKLYDVEDESKEWELNLQKLLSGYILNCEKRPHDCDIEDGDATTADCIVQYALFGDVIYG